MSTPQPPDTGAAVRRFERFLQQCRDERQIGRHEMTPVDPRDVRQQIESAQALTIGMALAARDGCGRPLTEREADELTVAFETALGAIKRLAAQPSEVERPNHAKHAAEFQQRSIDSANFDADAQRERAEKAETQVDRLTLLNETLDQIATREKVRAEKAEADVERLRAERADIAAAVGHLPHMSKPLVCVVRDIVKAYPSAPLGWQQRVESLERTIDQADQHTSWLMQCIDQLEAAVKEAGRVLDDPEWVVKAMKLPLSPSPRQVAKDAIPPASSAEVASRLEEKRPLPPEILADALQDRPHVDSGRSRPRKSVRVPAPEVP